MAPYVSRIALPPFFLISTTLIAEEPMSMPMALLSAPPPNPLNIEKKFFNGLAIMLVLYHNETSRYYLKYCFPRELYLLRRVRQSVVFRLYFGVPCGGT